MPNGFPDPERTWNYSFPTILSYDYLREEYESDFNSFQSQYMLDEYGDNEVVFSAEQMLMAMRDEADMPLEGQTFIHWRFPCRSNKWQAASAAVCTHPSAGTAVTSSTWCSAIHKPSVLAVLVNKLARKHGLHRHRRRVSHRRAAHATGHLETMRSTTGVGCVSHNWQESIEDTGERSDTRIRGFETHAEATGRLVLLNRPQGTIKPLMAQFTQYGMMDETAIPDAVSR